MFFLARTGQAVIPETLRGVTIISEMLDGQFVHRIFGFDILARTIVSRTARSIASYGAHLMDVLRNYGVIQHITSAGFGVSCQLLRRVFMNNTASIVIFHPTIRSFDDSIAIRALRYGVNRYNDRDYRAQNKPGFFIGDDNTKLSQVGARRILGQGAQWRLMALMRRYIDGGRSPVEEIIQEQLVTVRV